MTGWQTAPAAARELVKAAVPRADEVAAKPTSGSAIALPFPPSTTPVVSKETTANRSHDAELDAARRQGEVAVTVPSLPAGVHWQPLARQPLYLSSATAPPPRQADPSTAVVPLMTTALVPKSRDRQLQPSVDNPAPLTETPQSEPKPDPPKKAPKSVAPLLNQFFATSEATTTPAIAVSPPGLQRPTPSDKPAPAASELPSDPELGVIQVSEVQRDDELGVIQLRNPLQDPELGILELQQISPPPRRNPWLFLSAFVAASNSDNVFLVEDPVLGRFGDNFIRPGVSLTAFPAIGPQTNLLVSARTSLLRYEEQSNSSYDELRFQTGVRHQFSQRVYGQLSFSHQQLFDEGYEDQFFTNTGIELTVGRRDSLTPQLTLDSYYQGQVFFSDPARFSNVLNSVGTYLGYRITNRLDTGVSYRLTVSDFTQQSRHETYQRITGQLRYAITPVMRLSLFGGVSYGRSSESRITFDDTFFGISFDATVSIF